MSHRLGRRDLLNLFAAGGTAMLAPRTSADEIWSLDAEINPDAIARRHGLCLNEDDSHFYFNGEGHGVDAAAVDAWVDQYGHTQVRELMLCPNAMRTSYASNVWTPIWKGLDPQAGPDQGALRQPEAGGSTERLAVRV